MEHEDQTGPFDHRPGLTPGEVDSETPLSIDTQSERPPEISFLESFCLSPRPNQITPVGDLKPSVGELREGKSRFLRHGLRHSISGASVSAQSLASDRKLG
jgi:hypothetical protein